MASALEQIRQKIQQANQGNTQAEQPAPTPGQDGFSIGDGMINSPGAQPKNLSGSYMS
jgi:hypothetical protein